MKANDRRGKYVLTQSAIWALVLSALGTSCARTDAVVPIFDFAEHASSRRLRVLRHAYDFTAAEHVQLLLSDGWSTPEVRPEDDLSYAWAIGLEARLLPFFLLGRDVESADDGGVWLHFRCWPHALGSRQRQVVTVDLNGTTLGTLVLPPGLREYSLQVPAEALKSGQNSVIFRFAYAVAPAELADGTTDKRRLAAAFDYVSISADAEPAPPSPFPELDVIVRDEQFEQPAGSELSFDVKIPSQGFLEFGINSMRSGSAAALVVRHEDEERVLFEGSSAGWFRSRRRIDLSEFSGETVELRFRADPGEDDGTVIWERPELIGNVGALNLDTNVLLIVVDTLRADHVGSYGGTAATPHIDALAAEGVRFERAYTNIPITVPSHSSMFTSLLPSGHGVHSNFVGLNEGHLTLAELLGESYRDTAAFVSLGVLKTGAGLAQGFYEYHDRFGLDWWKPAQEMTQEILNWARRRSSAPFFLWAHYSDPHAPYAAPGPDRPQLSVEQQGGASEPIVIDATTTPIPLTIPPGETVVRIRPAAGHRLREVRLRDPRTRNKLIEVSCSAGCRLDRYGGFVIQLPATLTVRNPSDREIHTDLLIRPEEILSLQEIRKRYAEEVEYSDQQVGHLLTALRQAGHLDDTLVIFTADHGEGLGDHDGTSGHTSQLYESQLRVPLILSWPGHLPAGKVIDAPVSLIDLLPTVTNLLDIPDASQRTGRSLVSVMADTVGSATAPPIVAETFQPEAPIDLKAVVADGHKLIVAPADDDAVELYDLISDFKERVNRAAQETELVTDLRRRLQAELENVIVHDSDELELGEEEMQRLRALGYVR